MSPGQVKKQLVVTSINLLKHRGHRILNAELAGGKTQRLTVDSRPIWRRAIAGAQKKSCSSVGLGNALGTQLVVVGIRRRNSPTRWHLGSASLNLLHHSKVPVVLCPFDEY